ncbi:hypothetical protein [Fundidesulfovibrio putealis]|uniref:hypothetical protein n=1 Tax=Fundidesulfovibrio putealis TaxID=270496 RepID=UPI0004153375|nr:hypothetical protein [Fundidesulfovibrio putealis]
MKILYFFIALSLALIIAKDSNAMVVTCTNCSQMFTQALERVTSLEKLQQVYKQVSEAMTQTEKQITMVQQNMDRYKNMLQNTVKLPMSVLGSMKGTFSQLSSLSQGLNLQRGDASALSQIFKATYANRGAIKDLFKTSKPDGAPMTEEERAASEAAFLKMREQIEKEAEQAQEAAFQESGGQIEEIEQKAAELDSQLDDLLLTPDGQMKALEAGNQIATMQLRESQRLRQLLAVSIQSSVQRDMKDEKDKQMHEEAWKAATGKMFNTNALDAVVNSNQRDPSGW